MAKALITSGGGAKGAFTVGALLALKERGKLPFDVISGTSTGSFIAALAAVDDLETLRQQYLSVEPNDILAKQNIIENVLNGKAFLFDTHPLLKLIDHHITQSVFDRIMLPGAPTLCFTAVSLQTGIATIFSNRDLMPPANHAYKVRKIANRKELVDALMASGSQAGFTPAVEINGEQFVDGGHRDVIPSQIVVDLGIEEVYVVSNNPAQQFTTQKKYNDLLSVILRVISIFVQDVRETDVKILEDFLASKGKKPIRIEPASDLDEENPTGLRFNPMAMAAWMNLGKKRVEAILGPVPLNPV
ncbi:MAG TPA: patatin-like phospholipase family protein [Ohtaekwangia sp.]